MIGGKLEDGDVFIEVEDLKTYNIAPPVYAAQEYITDVANGGAYEYATWNNYEVVSGTRRMYPPWVRTGPDFAGNYQYTLNNQSMPAKVIGVRVHPDFVGVAGKYYSVSVDVKTYVTAMPGAFDYINQPPARMNLYATNGNEAQDVLIAQSPVINPTDPANANYPFHPGWRKTQVRVAPVAAMPVGKTGFRFKIEHEYGWTANKTIWLPQDYYGSGNPLPPQLAMWEVNFDECNLYEETSGIQKWVSSVGATELYNAGNESIQVPSGTPGIEATFEVPDDALIETYGGSMSFYAVKTGSFDVNFTGGSLSHTITLPADPNRPNYRTVITGIPAAVFDGGVLNVEYELDFVSGTVLIADIDPDGTDGINYFTYVDKTDSVSEINIQRYDSEVSTCNVTLRDSSSVDIDDTFGPGKEVRIRTNTYPGVVEAYWRGFPMDYKNTVFRGKIEKRDVLYPRGARPEVKVLITNSFPVLLEKTEYAFRALETYGWVVPYLGVTCLSYRGGVGYVEAAKAIDPNASADGNADYTGMWTIKDDSKNMTYLDALMITRNTQFGFAWFDKYNRLVLKPDPPTETIVFTDSMPAPGEFSYGNIDLQYGTTNVINYVALSTFAPSESVDEDGEIKISVNKQELSFYDDESIRKYRKAEYKLQMFARTNYDEIYTRIIEPYKTPKITATNLRFPVRTQSELEKVTTMDLYQTIDVTYEDKLDQKYRITRMSHLIRPGETWVTELGFGLNTDSTLW